MQVFASPSQMSDVPTMATLTYLGSSNVKYVNLRNLDAFREAFPQIPDTNFVWRFYGQIRIIEKGQYTFCTVNDDGARLFVNDLLLLRNSWVNRKKCATRTLNAGMQRLSIDGWNNGGGAQMVLTYAGLDTNSDPMDVTSLDRSAPPAPPPSRFTLRTFQSLESISLLPELKDTSMVGEATVPAIDFSNLANFRRWIPATPDSMLVWQVFGKVAVYRPGKYTFCSTSRGGSKLWMDGGLVVNNDGAARMGKNRESLKLCGEVSLTKGHHDLEIRGFSRKGNPQEVAVYKGPDTGEEERGIDSVDPLAPPPPRPSEFLLRVYRTTSLTRVPEDWSGLRLVGETVVPELNFGGTGAGDFGKFVEQTPATNYAFVGYGKFAIGAGGSYSFCVNSKDGSILEVDGRNIINNDGRHATRRRCANLTVRPGIHLIKVMGFHSGGRADLEVTYSGADTSTQRSPVQSLSADPF